MSNRRITVYDTTLRDGAQGPAVSFSASDKLRIARTLDELGFEDDGNLAALLRSGAPVWTLVGKSDSWQVSTVLQTTNNENLAMVEESVAYGVSLGRELIFDAEHFFDGFARDAEYAVEVCLTAARAGAGWVVLCDTNGGSLPSEIRQGVLAVRRALADLDLPVRVGIHTHNDCEL